MSTSQIYDLNIWIQIRYQMLNIRTRIRTDLNSFKRIRSRIRFENISTFYPTVQRQPLLYVPFWHFFLPQRRRAKWAVRGLGWGFAPLLLASGFSVVSWSHLPIPSPPPPPPGLGFLVLSTLASSVGCRGGCWE